MFRLTRCLLSLLAVAGISTFAADFPRTLDGGAWKAGHVQGVAIDPAKGFVYYSFTTLLVKTDLTGRVMGTLGGFTGHLGDLAFHKGKVYGSLEYKADNAFYIAIIDVDRINASGLQAQNSDIFRTVYLTEVAEDFKSGHYGCSGIDGVAFGPKFGKTGGKQYLTVAYGIFGDVTRQDNDHQVLLQYDIASWDRYAKPLNEASPHRSGPAKFDGGYFVHTGNTKFGVQNLEYDAHTRLWLMGVYAGAKPAFPNYTLFAVEASAKPRVLALKGTNGWGLLLPLVRDGWFQKADVGMVSLGGGLFYLAQNGTKDGLQTAELRLHRWTGGTPPFTAVP